MKHNLNLPFRQGNFEYQTLAKEDLREAARFAAGLMYMLEPLVRKSGISKEDLYQYILAFSEATYEQNYSIVVKDEGGAIVGVSYLYDHFTKGLPNLGKQSMKPLAEIKSLLMHKFYEFIEADESKHEAVAEWFLVAIHPKVKSQKILDTVQELGRNMLMQSGYDGVVMVLTSPLTQHFIGKDRFNMFSKTFSAEVELDSFSFQGEHVFRKINDSLPMEYRWRSEAPKSELIYLNFHAPFPQKPSNGKMERYGKVLEQVRSQKTMMLGKPGNMDFDFSPLAEVLQVFMNNSGHPFTPSSHRLDTKALERELIYFFARSYGLTEEETFGYVTSGGSEAMEYGLWTGFKKLENPVVLLSEETHYAAMTILRKFNRPFEVIPCLDSGEMDYCKLEEVVNGIESPVLVIANIGSTMKGAIDDVRLIKEILKDKAHYIHADAALHGAFLPFLPKFYEKYRFDLRDNIDSLSISLHKFLGNITPAGLVITAKKNLMQEAYIEYIASDNLTLSCSRSGLAVLLANYRIDTIGGEYGLREMATRCLCLTSYLLNRLKTMGIEAKANESSNIVYFPSLPNDLASKWMLPNSKGITHVVVMPHVTKELIDQFLEDVSHHQELSVGHDFDEVARSVAP